MKVVVGVWLDDGTQMSMPVNVNSGGNAAFWAAGFLKGATSAANRLALAIMAVHGGKAGGVHVVSHADMVHDIEVPVVIHHGK